MEIKKVAVILGGTSTERDISLRSGQAVYKCLIKKGYNAFKIDPKLDNIYNILTNERPDMVFIALHGQGGEDGTIQGFLDYLKIPYTGNSLLASVLCMNKIFTQNILKANNILIPEFFTINKTEYKILGIKGIYKKIKESFGFPVIVKAPSQGSTLGIYFINNKDEDLIKQLTHGIKNAFKLEDILLIESMITPSTEITISVLGNQKPVALPTLEITTVTGHYDYIAKYTQGICKHIIPARLPLSVRQKAQTIAIQIYKLLQCNSFARLDFMIQNSNIYMIDINTIPGLTDMSLLPDAAKAIGIDFSDLVQLIIEMANGKEFPFKKYKDVLLEIEKQEDDIL